MVSLLEVIPEYVLHWLVQNGTERRLKQDEVLLTGWRRECIALHCAGRTLRCAVCTIRRDGEADHAGPGSLLGETSYFGDGTEPASIIALEPSLVLEITRNRFESKLQYDHAYAADFFRALLTTMSTETPSRHRQAHGGGTRPRSHRSG